MLAEENQVLFDLTAHATPTECTEQHMFKDREDMCMPSATLIL